MSDKKKCPFCEAIALQRFIEEHHSKPAGFGMALSAALVSYAVVNGHKCGRTTDYMKDGKGYFNIDLTADDGLKNYGGDRVRIGLITCEEYRLLRGNIPALPDRWWWTATPDSPINSFVRNVYSDGSLNSGSACYGHGGVRPLCNLKSEILVQQRRVDTGSSVRKQDVHGSGIDRVEHVKIPRPRKGQLRQLFRIHHKRRYCRNS